MRTFASEDGASLALETEPYLWDIDRYPTVTFSYRLPKDVPLGVWLRCFNQGGQEEPRVCIGASPALETSTQIARILEVVVISGVII